MLVVLLTYFIRIFLTTRGFWTNWKGETSESTQYISNKVIKVTLVIEMGRY